MGTDRLVVMSAWRNRDLSSDVEHPDRGGHFDITRAIAVFRRGGTGTGIPMDVETLRDLLLARKLKPEDLEGARPMAW